VIDLVRKAMQKPEDDWEDKEAAKEDYQAEEEEKEEE